MNSTNFEIKDFNFFDDYRSVDAHVDCEIQGKTYSLIFQIEDGEWVLDKNAGDNEKLYSLISEIHNDEHGYFSFYDLLNEFPILKEITERLSKVNDNEIKEIINK